MAYCNSKAAMFFNLALILSLLLIISMAESRSILGSAVEMGKAKPTLVCNTIFGARAGDTCFGITKLFNLTPEFFSEINPNLVCDEIFVGEWICVNGFVI